MLGRVPGAGGGVSHWAGLCVVVILGCVLWLSLPPGLFFPLVPERGLALALPSPRRDDKSAMSGAKP